MTDKEKMELKKLVIENVRLQSENARLRHIAHSQTETIESQEARWDKLKIEVDRLIKYAEEVGDTEQRFHLKRVIAFMKEFSSCSLEMRTKDKIFHDHIKAHFEEEHPDWKVHCTMCKRTYDEIVSSGEIPRDGNPPSSSRPRGFIRTVEPTKGKPKLDDSDDTCSMLRGMTESEKVLGFTRFKLQECIDAIDELALKELSSSSESFKALREPLTGGNAGFMPTGIKGKAIPLKVEAAKRYKCCYCGTETFEGDRNHYVYYDGDGAHCCGISAKKEEKA